MFDKLIEFLARRPWLPLLIVALITVYAASSCFDRNWHPRIAVDPSTEKLLPANDVDRLSFEHLRATFGDTDAVLLAVRFDPVFTADHLAAIARLSDALRRVEGVKSVYSLATAPNLLASGEDIEVSSFTEQAAADPSSVAALKSAFERNAIYRGTLVSADGNYASLVISLDGVDEVRFLREHYEQRLRDIAFKETGSSEIHVTGASVIKAATTLALLDTLAFTIPTIYGLIVVLLLIAFRSVRATLTAVVGVSIAMIWTLAAAAALEIPLNVVTVITPPLVVTLGLAYAIHLLSDFFSEPARTADERRARSAHVMRELAPALLLATATTIAGFLALLINALPAIRQFVWLSVLGVFFLLLLTLFFMPAMLSITRCGRQEQNHLGQRLASRFAGPLARFDTRWRGRIIGVALVIVPLCLWLATGIPVGADYVKGFVAGHPARVAYEAINREFNGANLVAIHIDSHLNDALTEPELMQAIDSLQSWLRAQPEVGATVSYVDHLKLIHQSMNDGADSAYVLPDSAAAAKQLLVFAGSDDLRRFVDPRFREALISVRLNVNDSAEIARFAERTRVRLEQLPQPLDGELTGSSILATRTVEAIGQGQWLSLAVAGLVILALLSLMFTSVIAGLWALLPNLLPVAVYFGLLRILDIPLNPTNSLIASIVLGIAVDDTVHFLARFNSYARSLGNEQLAVEKALAGTLRPTTLNTLALCLGLLMFAGSELKSQVQFGLLASFTLFIGWISEITLTPALATRLKIVTLWDIARLDLGQSPQHTIPLFAGLSLRQARVFALISKLERHQAGEQVIRQGDVARDMYVVLDGEVEIWIDRGNEHQTLTHLSRGAVLGEAGYFGQKRTANALATTPVRVLRFDSQDLERVRRRYPRIAATVFRNLNRVQAERLARATAMLQESQAPAHQ
ncbi:MMPL family transporter [Hydrocarboniphaga sp.]|uniref:MMPL family transporter n=1 Tax=Hydrocarboniphaga sp. TaxID=2033016 RepID=UPI003D107C5B